MKKLLLFSFACMQSFIIPNGEKHLNNFRENITKAASAPFVALPYYGCMTAFYFAKMPDDQTVRAWNDNLAPINHQTISASSRTNKFVLNEAKRKLESRNTSARMALDTAISASGLGFSSFLFQYICNKYSNTSSSLADINSTNIMLWTGVGAFIGLSAHASMSYMHKKTETVARTKNK